MYARVARWEGGDPEAIRKAAAELGDRAASGPPEGVPGKGFILLTDPENGRGLAIGFFETMEDLETGDRVLRDMTPPTDAMGKVTSVEKYEVGIDVGVAQLS